MHTGNSSEKSDYIRISAINAIIFLSGCLFCTAPAHAETFQGIMAYVYQNDPALVAEREALKNVDEGVAEAVSGYRPSVTADYDRGRQRIYYNGNSSYDYGNDQTKDIRLVQPLFNGFGTVAQVDAAKARVKAGQARLQATEQRVLLDAVIAQANLVEKRDVLASSKWNAYVLSEQRKDAMGRFQGGELTQTDVSQAEARFARAEGDLAQAEADSASAEAQFVRAIGFKPQAVALPPLPPGLPATLEEAQALAQTNPALVEAQFREKAADRDIEERTSALWPNVSLQASATDNQGGDIPGVTSYREDAITVNVSIPLYESGAEYARIREAEDLYQKAHFDSLGTSRSTTEFTRHAWEDYVASHTIVGATEQAAIASYKAFGGVSQENKFGTRTVLDVLNAQQEYFASYVSLEHARRLERIAAYQLLAATGKLSAQNLKLPVTLYDPNEHYHDVRYQAAGF